MGNQLTAAWKIVDADFKSQKIKIYKTKLKFIP